MLKVPHRILIVDDDKDIVANLSDILSDVGYETETAFDGKCALKKVDSANANSGSEFDLCLLDFKMPDMDGVELLKKMHVRSPRLRSIMITAYAGDDGAQRALAAGILKVLRKPVDIEELLCLIDDTVA